MLLAALIVTAAPPAIWRSYEEVFDLALQGGVLLAATSGGVLRYAGGAWDPVGASPAEARGLTVDAGALVARTSDGRTFRWSNGKWSRTEIASHSAQPLAAPKELPGQYCAAEAFESRWAGTADGLFRLVAREWKRERLPSQLPFTGNVEGIADFGGTYLVGGTNGLYLGVPGNWTEVSRERVRQILPAGDSAWVLYGNGAVDKVMPRENRLYDDVLAGGVKRPWTSCLGSAGASPHKGPERKLGVLFGGLGGWIEKTPKGLEEHYPKELQGEPVTAILREGSDTWVGTQRLGLFRFSNKTKTWNPGNGLGDTWVTALVRDGGRVLVGTATKGLYQIESDVASMVESPTEDVRCLLIHGSCLVMGGMDGAWIREGPRWRNLATQNEETTGLSLVAGRLVVTTWRGVFFL